MNDDEDETLNEQILQNILSSVNQFDINDYVLSDGGGSQPSNQKLVNGEDVLMIDDLLNKLHYEEKRPEIDKMLNAKREAKEREEQALILQRIHQQQIIQQQQQQQQQELDQLQEDAEIDQQALDHIDSLLRSSKMVSEQQNSEVILQSQPSTENIPELAESDPEVLRHKKKIAEIRNHFTEIVEIPELTEYLGRPASRLQNGRARVIRLCAAYYAVGTTHGVILLFMRPDMNFVQLKLDTPKHYIDVNQYNSVTCIDLTPSGDLILSGYERGDIVLWETKSLTAIKKFNITNLLREVKQKVGSYISVDNVCFLHDKMQFLVSCGHNLLMVRLSKVLFRITSDCKSILRPRMKFGPIRDVSVLPEGLAPHPTNRFLLIAVATDAEVLIINLKVTSSLHIPYKLTKPSEAEESSVPYLAWRRVLPPIHVPIPVENNHATDFKGRNPHLAVGWGKVINLFQFYLYKEKQSLEMNRVSFMHSTSEVLGLCWLEERVLGIIDSSFQVSIADPFVQTTVQKLNIKDVEPVFHSRFDKGVENASDTHRVPIPSYHYSFQELHGILYVLGEKVISMKVLNWKQRIEALIQTGSWVDSIQLALDFYQGREMAVVGLPSDIHFQQILVGEVIKGMLIDYLDTELLEVSSSSFEGEEQKSQYFEKLGNYCVGLALEIKAPDLIFGPIFERFMECKEENTFMLLVESAITKGKLRTVPEQFLNDFVATFISSHLYSRLEACLINLDVETKNASELLAQCLRHNMYKAYVYILNRVNKDHINPIQTMLKMIYQFKQNEDDESQNKVEDPFSIEVSCSEIQEMLFTYLRKLIEGEEYPSGPIPHQVLAPLKVNILNYLFSEKARFTYETSEYLYILRLLALNTKDTLGLINTLLQDKSPTSPWLSNTERLYFDQQAILKLLISLVIDTTVDPFSPWEINKRACSKIESWYPNVDEVAYFLQFLLTYMVDGMVETTTDLIHRSIAVLGFEGGANKSDRVSDIQEKLMKILERHEGLTLDVKKMLQLCESAKFYKIAILLQSKYENYDRILDSYLKDPNLRVKIFQYLHETLNKLKVISASEEPQVDKKDGYTKLREAIINHLSILVDLSADETSQLILYHFTENYEQIIEALAMFPLVQLKLLKNLIGVDENSSVSHSMNELLLQKGIQVGPELHDTFLALMAQYEPNNVLGFLRSHEGFYDLDHALNICKKYKVINATAFLLENAGDIPGAVNMYLETLVASISDLKARLADVSKQIDPTNTEYLDLEPFRYINTHSDMLYNKFVCKPLPMINNKYVLEIEESETVRKSLKKAVGVCERNSANEIVDTKVLKRIWIGLLDTFVQLQCEHRKCYLKDSKILTANPATPKSRKKQQLMKVTESSISLSDFDAEVSIEQDIREHNVKLIGAQDRIHSLEEQIMKEFSQEKLDKLQKSLKREREQMEALKTNLDELYKAQKQAMNNPLAAHNLPKLANLLLQICLGTYINFIYSSMITSHVFEWAEILEFTVTRYGCENFGHFKEPLTELFTNCTFEGTLYKSMKDLLNKDLYSLHRSYSHGYLKGIQSIGHQCHICDCVLYTVSDDADEMEIKIFNCGHMYHATCFATLNMSNCPICNKQQSSSFSRALAQLRNPQQAAAAKQKPPKPTSSKPAIKRHRLRRVDIALGSHESKLKFQRPELYDISNYFRDVQRERKQQVLIREQKLYQQQNEVNSGSTTNPDEQLEEDIAPAPFAIAKVFRRISFFGGKKNNTDQQQQGIKSDESSAKPKKIYLAESFDDFL